MSTASMSIARTARRRSPLTQVRRYLRSPKGTLTLVFLPLLALAGESVGRSQAWPHVVAAVLGAALVDLLLARVRRDAWVWPGGALLSGLIVAFILGVQETTVVTFAVGALASASKYMLRTPRSHIFNPAAPALVVSVPLFGTGQSWWGALPGLPWPWLLLLLALGAYLIDRLNKFPLVLSFLGTYFGLFTFAALANPTRVAEMFRAPFLQAAVFLACFMLTDPPTSPGRPAEQVRTGVLVAIVAAVAQLLGAGQSYLLLGLLAGNAVLAAQRWWQARQTHRPGRPETGTRLPRPDLT